MADEDNREYENAVPESMRCLTGECEVAQRRIDEFLLGVKDYILSRHPEKPEEEMYFETRVMELCRPEPVPRPTNEGVHMLLYRERVVALVTETRNDFNNVQYDFFKNLQGLDDERDL